MLERPISKSGWTRVSLGDVVENINDYFERDVDEPTRYVAGEHVDEGQLTVRRWGMTDDGFFPPTFKRRFRAGDVLFHSRNIKKVASPNFDGVTGEKLFVLRSKDQSVLLQEFLGHLLSAPDFFSYAEQNWSGSVNKFFNWRPLRQYKFLLPPIQEQARVVSGLTVANDVVEKLVSLHKAQHSVVQSTLMQALDPTGRPRVKIGDVAIRVTNGFVGSAVKHYVDDGIPYLRSLNVRRSGLDFSDMVYISREFHEATQKSQLQEGDVLTVQSGHVGETAVVPKSCVGWNCHALIVTRLDQSRINPDYLAIYLNSEVGQRHLQRFFVGSTVAHLNTSDLEKLTIPFPSFAEQANIADLGRRLLMSVDEVKQRLESAQSLSREMRERALSGGET